MAEPVRLREAWHRVRTAAGAPGPDGVSVRGFGTQLETRLRDLAQAIAHGGYNPGPLRRVLLAKTDGGFRTLGIPNVVDRVAQNAAALVLQDHFAGIFSAASYAYRPLLGPRRAALRLMEMLTPASWVVIADIEKFFDNVEHRILFEQLRAYGIDDTGLEIIGRWITAPVQGGATRLQSIKGLPQGTPIAPVLANVYLTGLDLAILKAGFAHVRYADDLVVIAGSEADARNALEAMRSWLAEHLSLSIKPGKTLYTTLQAGFSFVGFYFTPAGPMLSDERRAHFQSAVGSALAPSDGRRIAEVSVAHNELVRGWRHYYAGLSAALDGQLSVLEAWRAQACETWLRNAGLHPELERACFQKLVLDEMTPSANAYPEWLEDGPADDQIAVPEVVEATRQTAHTPTFSSGRAIRSSAIGETQRPEFSPRGDLWLPMHGAFVTRSKSVLVVRRKKQTIFECAFDDLRQIIVNAEGVVLSTSALSECCRRRISVLMCRSDGTPLARVSATRPDSDVAALERQLAARDDGTAASIAASMLCAKIRNQRALLLYHGKAGHRDQRLRASLRATARRVEGFAAACSPPLECAGRAEWRTRAFQLEAKAAAWYWYGVRLLVPPVLGFSHRHGRGATDPLNQLLNFGYWLLHARVWAAIERAGLQPGIGMLHTGRRRSAGLVFDLMEEFRQPIVDRAVLGIIGRKARIEVNQRGMLRLRTRRMVQRAIARTIEGGRGGSRFTLAERIELQAAKLRRSVLNGAPYSGYVMRW